MGAEQGPRGIPIPLGYSGWAWEVTEYNVLAEEEQQGQEAGRWAYTDCLGIVLHADSVRSASQEPPPRNPRRTRKVRTNELFTGTGKWCRP